MVASKNLAKDFGIIIYEKIFEEKESGKYGEFEVERSTKGGILLNIGGERIFLYSLPYISEAFLDEEYKKLLEEKGEELGAKFDVTGDYSQKIGRILKNGVAEVEEENIPKVVMAHLFIMGSSGDGDERGVELGGSKGVDLNDLPEVDYIALGHIHKPMLYRKKRACYSGSPIEYRVTENRYQKKLFIVDVEGNFNTQVKEIELENYKPIRRYEINGVDEGIEFAQSHMDVEEWIYLKILTDRYLTSGEIREIRKNKNIVDFNIVYQNSETQEEITYFENGELNIEESFREFYKKFDGVEASEEIVELFMRILEGEAE